MTKVTMIRLYELALAAAYIMTPIIHASPLLPEHLGWGAERTALLEGEAEKHKRLSTLMTRQSNGSTPAGNQDLAGKICGTKGDTNGADDYRVAETWKTYKVDDWLNVAVKTAVDSHWKAGTGAKPYNNWQSWLWAQGGPDGATHCETLGANCEPSLSYELCKETPEAHFAMWGTINFANFMNSLWTTLGAIRDWTDGVMGDLVNNFFTPRKPATNLILPLAITAGILSALTALAPLYGGFAIAAIGAGAMSILQGIATQDELNRPNPLDLFTEVQPLVTKLWDAITKAADSLYHSNLLDPPIDKDGGVLGNKTSMAGLLLEGKFAQPMPLTIFDPNIKQALTASPVNALWIADGVYIVRGTPAVFENVKGFCDGSKCKFKPDICVCIDGVAHWFIRWLRREGTLDLKGSVPADVDDWYVWGAYAAGPPSSQDKKKLNANHLTELNTDLGKIAKSAMKTQQSNGGKPLKSDENLNKDILEQFKNDPQKITTDDVVRWSLPVCDLEEILKSVNNKYDHFQFGGQADAKDQKGLWTITMPCTCMYWNNWPRDEETYAEPKGLKDKGSIPDRGAKDGRACGGWRHKCESNQQGAYDKGCDRG